MQPDGQHVCMQYAAVPPCKLAMKNAASLVSCSVATGMQCQHTRSASSRDSEYLGASDSPVQHSTVQLHAHRVNLPDSMQLPHLAKDPASPSWCGMYHSSLGTRWQHQGCQGRQALLLLAMDITRVHQLSILRPLWPLGFVPSDGVQPYDCMHADSIIRMPAED
jgi:hypothetical protein